MKYGKKLPSRSVPEWRAHNILYEDIRDLIVQETEGGTVSRDGYGRIFAMLSDEYYNVNLFVRSKLGEIEQRLRACQRLVAAISSLADTNSSQGEGGARSDLDSGLNESMTERDAKIYQLQCEVARVSRDIQHLSRFAGAQFTGFRKLIKKYRKLALTSPGRLDEFEALLNGPESFASIDFTTTFLELSLLYDMLRSGKFVPVESLSAWSDTGDRPQSLENRLCQFDTRMVSTPTQTEYFWVHNEDIMQIKVFLLQHLGLVAGSDRPQITRTRFFDTADYELAMTGREPSQLHEVELLPTQDAKENEASPGAVSQAVFCAPTGGMRYFCAATVSPAIKKKLKAGTLSARDLDGLDNNAKFALGWALSRHVRSQAAISSSRLRYEAPYTPGDPSAQQVWAAIDSNIIVHKCADPLARLPHHVLQIRYTGGERPAWVAELAKSHLLFQVSDSFSLYRYALYLFQTHDVFRSTPSWASILEQGTDIRQAPKPVRSQRSRRSIRQTSTSSGGGTSASNGGGNSGSKKTILLNDTSLNDSARYWNEFDHPEDDDDANVFSVFINDEDEELMRILRAQQLSQPLMRFSKSVRRSVRHVKHLLGFDTSAASGTSGVEGDLSSDDTSETQSLLSSDRLNGAQYSPRLAPTTGPDSDDLELGSAYMTERRIQRRENMLMAMLTTACLTLAAIIDVMVYAILFSEEVEDLVVGAQVVLVIGLILSAVLSALGAMAFRLHSSSHWLPQIAVHAIWFTVMCFSVGGIAWIVTT